jgi:hypothetical protein
MRSRKCAVLRADSIFIGKSGFSKKFQSAITFKEFVVAAHFWEISSENSPGGARASLDGAGVEAR